MTTANKLASINVTINFTLPMECYDVDDFAAMDAAEVSKLYSELLNEREREFYGVCVMSDTRYSILRTIEAFYYLKDVEVLNRLDRDSYEYYDMYKSIYGHKPL